MLRKRLIHTVFSISCCISILNRDVAAAGNSLTLITPEHARSIYRNLVEVHWIPRTGLFTSFPDSNDRKLSQQASTYEQAAMGLLAIRMGDIERAQGILRFLKTAWVAGPQKTGPRQGVPGLVNFYNAYFGFEGIENRIHLGPNAWAGLFAARLANTTQDRDALQFALDVAYWARVRLPHENGAVAMGPRNDSAPWTRVFSTENNLSYYAMLTELLRNPRLDKDQYRDLALERDHVENWLLTTVLNRKTFKLYRGISPQGIDGIQALDTVTWLISAVGPQKIAQRGIDPFKLMDTAASSFEVDLAGLKGVDPTDQHEAMFTFAHDRAAPGESTRPDDESHRMIWYEGQGQYILALAAMADYAQKVHRSDLARRYRDKARALTQAFDASALDRYPGKAAYPYATPGRFFRDGWRTPPESAEGPASSLISGIWRCFAGLGLDPLSGRTVGSIQQVKVTAPVIGVRSDKKPVILYGTSEDMVVAAWRNLQAGQSDLAIEQAQATIAEWAPWAMQLQARKMKEVGHIIDDSGSLEDRKKIFSYWALNDVAAAYFILGKALHEKKDYASAGRAFQQIINHYSLAQVWDSQGWFWSPADAVNSDYVSSNPEHYAWLVPQDLAAGQTVGKNPY